MRQIRALITAFLVVSSAACTLAERNKLKPTDFEPLTSLPWKKPDATLENVLDAIFREPNYFIRYGVLGEYLRIVPVANLGKAFDICVVLEGAQTPDSLVELFLGIWAKRDPRACWKRTKELFRLVGIEEGWLGYDSWSNPRITVTDRNAIQASPFWLQFNDTLTSFALGVDASSLPKGQRVRLMKEFTDVWFDTFASWPGGGSWHPSERPPEPPENDRRLIEIFELSVGDVKSDSFLSSGWLTGNNGTDRALFEVGARRRLKEIPEDALKIIERARERRLPIEPGQTAAQAAEPSLELLTIWADVDFAAMRRWTESLDPRKDNVGVTARGMLLNRVDQDTRDRWLKHAGPVAEEDSYFAHLLGEWAKWDPKSALDAAVASRNNDAILEAVEGAVLGPSQCTNARWFGIGIVTKLDFAQLPAETLRELVHGSWNGDVMEWFGEIDVAGTAEHGLDFMARTNFTPRENLIKFFSGEDGYTDDDVIDRTFCALRVWAVVKPREMKAWIGTIKEADMRKALTWLLEHPWGTGPGPKE